MSMFFPHAVRWLRQVGKALHQIWLEVTGTLFLGMGVMALPAALKEWRRYLDGGSLWRPLLVALFVVMMVSFGIFSFLRARRLR